MHITGLVCIQEKFTKPDHRSFANLRLFFFFFNHWSIHLFQSNQRFQAIRFVDRPVPEKIYIFHITLISCMAFVTPRYLSPVSTAMISFSGRVHEKKKKKGKKSSHFLRLAAKASETNLTAEQPSLLAAKYFWTNIPRGEYWRETAVFFFPFLAQAISEHKYPQAAQTHVTREGGNVIYIP